MEEIPPEDVEVLHTLGFDVKERKGRGMTGIVFRGVCNQLAERNYLSDEFEATVTPPSSARFQKKVTREKLSGREFAIKWIEPNSVVYEELKNLMELRHPNIVDIFGIYKGETENVYIITEFLKGQDLLFWLDGEEPSEEICLDIMRQLVEGLVYIHSKGLLHKDIHSGNIMITENEDYKNEVKYIDFGSSRPVDASEGENRFMIDIKKLGYVFRRIIAVTQFKTPELKQLLIELGQHMRECQYLDIKDVKTVLHESVDRILPPGWPHNPPSPESEPLTPAESEPQGAQAFPNWEQF